MQRTYNKITFISLALSVLLILLFLKTFATTDIMIKNSQVDVKTTHGQLFNASRKLTGSEDSLIDTRVGNEATQLAIQFNTMQYNNEQEQLAMRASIIDTKRNSFVLTKTLNEQSIVMVEPLYGIDNKQVIERRSESMCLDIRTRSNWTYEDFDAVLNEEMKDLIPVALRLEEEVGINALYIIAVGANETGWGKYMAGRYNYFNWTNDGVDHFDFEALEKFSDFSVKTYRDNYVNETFYEGKLGFVPEHITLEVVNVKYAINPDKTTNWQWSNVVAEIMSNISDRRMKSI